MPKPSQPSELDTRLASSDTVPDTADATLDELAEIKSKTVGGATSFFLRTLLIQMVNIYTQGYLSAYLTVSDFGVYGYVTQIIGILVFFSDVGLAATLIQKKEEPTHREYSSAFSIQLLLSFFIVFCAVSIGLWLGILSQYGWQVFSILLALALSFPIASLKTIPSIQLERRLDFSKLVIPQVVETLVFNMVLLASVFSGLGLWSYTIAIVLRSLSGLCTLAMIQPWLPTFIIDKKLIRKLLSFGLQFQFNDFLARIKDQLFYIVIKRWMSDTEFGYIQWSKGWSMYPYQLTVQNVMSLTFPTFSRLQKSPKALAQALELSLYFVTLVIYPMLIGMAFFVPPLTVLVPQYIKWQPAVLSLGLFCFSIAWSALSTPLTNALMALGHISEVRNLMIMWTVLTWGLSLPLLWWLGYDAVAWASALIAVTSLLPAVLLKRHVEFSFFDSIWRQTAAAVVMTTYCWIGLSVWSSSWILFFFGGASSIIVYGAVFGMLGFSHAKGMYRLLRAK